MLGSFYKGFEKKASVSSSVGIDPLIATLAGLAGGTIAGTMFLGPALNSYHKHKLVDNFNNVMDKAPDKKRFEEFAPIFKKHPEIKFYSRKDIIKQINDGPLKKDRGALMHYYDVVKNNDNAAYYRNRTLTGTTPEIVVPDVVSASTLGHEIGHHYTKKLMLENEKERKRIEANQITEEQEAWKRSPIKVRKDIKDAALATYQGVGAKGYGQAAIAGGLLGALVGVVGSTIK